MRPQRNPLDLNNLPEEYGNQMLQVPDRSLGLKKKKDEKIYECRFCSLKFCKSQALGGHMNRHRQERESETLNRARQLVFSNESVPGTGAHIGLRDLHFGSSMQTMPSSCFQQAGNMGDPRLHFRPVYSRIQTPSPQTASHFQSYLYTSPTPPHPHQSPYPETKPSQPNMDDYYTIGRVLGSGASHNLIGREGPRPLIGREGPAISSAMDGGNWNSCNGHRFLQHDCY